MSNSKTQKSPFNYKTAFALALGISLLMNLLFFIVFFYGKNIVTPEEVEHIPPKFPFTTVLIHGFFNFILAFVLYLLNFRLFKLQISQKIKWFLIIALTLACMVALSYLFSVIRIQADDLGPHPERFIRGNMIRDSFIAIIVLLSTALLYLSHQQQQILLQNKTLLAENMQTRFSALKNQLDPHFLFNSLNTLNSLIKTDADKAQEYVRQLSSVFRYTLQNNDVISVREELKFTEAYCSLMQIRYGENLQFNILIDEKYNDYQILPISLQILVENAIKHNVVSNKQPLTVNIISSNLTPSISVSNFIQRKKEPESGEGIGLNNLSERYWLKWKKEILITQKGGAFEVTIPIMKV